MSIPQISLDRLLRLANRVRPWSFGRTVAEFIEELRRFLGLLPLLGDKEDEVSALDARLAAHVAQTASERHGLSALLASLLPLFLQAVSRRTEMCSAYAAAAEARGPGESAMADTVYLRTVLAPRLLREPAVRAPKSIRYELLRAVAGFENLAGDPQLFCDGTTVEDFEDHSPEDRLLALVRRALPPSSRVVAGGGETQSLILNPERLEYRLFTAGALRHLAGSGRVFSYVLGRRGLGYLSTPWLHSRVARAARWCGRALRSLLGDLRGGFASRAGTWWSVAGVLLLLAGAAIHLAVYQKREADVRGMVQQGTPMMPNEAQAADARLASAGGVAGGASR